MRQYYRNGCRLGVVCIGLILASGCASQMEQLSNNGNFFESARSDFAGWPSRIIEDSKETFFRRDNIAALLLAGGASIAMHNSDADDNIQNHVRKHREFNHGADETFDLVGNPGLHFAATGIWYALSAENQDELNKERAWTMMTALAVNGMVTVGLKAVRDNDCPNGKSWAWPSGHTSSSFTAAAVLDEFYGPKVGIPAYVLASVVAWRMVDSGDHWGSDVVFGATLGWVVGHTIAGKHKQLEIAGFKVLPYVGNANGPVVGVNLVKRF